MLRLLREPSVRPTSVDEVQSIASRGSYVQRKHQHERRSSACRRSLVLLPSAVKRVLDIFFNEHSTLLPANFH